MQKAIRNGETYPPVIPFPCSSEAVSRERFERWQRMTFHLADALNSITNGCDLPRSVAGAALDETSILDADEYPRPRTNESVPDYEEAVTRDEMLARGARTNDARCTCATRGVVDGITRHYIGCPSYLEAFDAPEVIAVERRPGHPLSDDVEFMRHLLGQWAESLDDRKGKARAELLDYYAKECARHLTHARSAGLPPENPRTTKAVTGPEKPSLPECENCRNTSSEVYPEWRDIRRVLREDGWDYPGKPEITYPPEKCFETERGQKLWALRTPPQGEVRRLAVAMAESINYALGKFGDDYPGRLDPLREAVEAFEAWIMSEEPEACTDYPRSDVAWEALRGSEQSWMSTASELSAEAKRLSKAVEQANRYVIASEAHEARDWGAFKVHNLAAVSVEYERMRDALIALALDAPRERTETAVSPTTMNTKERGPR